MSRQIPKNLTYSLETISVFLNRSYSELSFMTPIQFFNINFNINNGRIIMAPDTKCLQKGTIDENKFTTKINLKNTHTHSENLAYHWQIELIKGILILNPEEYQCSYNSSVNTNHVLDKQVFFLHTITIYSFEKHSSKTQLIELLYHERYTKTIKWTG